MIIRDWIGHMLPAAANGWAAMNSGEKLQFSAGAGNIVILASFAGLGAALAFLSTRALVGMWLYGAPDLPGRDVAASVMMAILSVCMVLFCVSKLTCRVVITDDSVTYRTLFTSKSIERRQIISARYRGGSGHAGWYVIRTEDKKMVISDIAFSADEMRRMKSVVGFSSPTAQRRFSWRS